MRIRHALLLFILLLSTALNVSKLDAQPQFNGIADYDFNANCTLDNIELFALFDDWNAKRISNSTFFTAVDLWITQAPIPGCKSINNFSCEFNGSLRASFTGDNAFVPIVNTGVEVDLFFTQRNSLPVGTTINLSISTNAQELVIADGGFTTHFQGARFSAPNPSYAIGTGVLNRPTVLSPNVEFASFRLRVVGGGPPTFTRVNISATIHRPDCPSVLQTTGFQIGIGS